MPFAGDPQRVLIPLSRGWSFARERVGAAWMRGDGAPDSVPVDLPHSWNARDTFQSGVRYYQGHGAYRAAFEIPASQPEGRTWHLRAGGFYGIGDVWVDGRRLARIDGQYLGFDLKLPALAAGRHTVGIRLDNRYHRGVLPGMPDPDFLLHGGLAAEVSLVGLPGARFVESQTWTRCVAADEDAATIEIPFGLRGVPALGAGAVVRWRLRDARGRELATHEQAASEGLAVARLVVNAPRLWSLDCPFLHEAVGELRQGGTLVDVLRLPVGIRCAEFRPGAGFFLNGERVELHGCNRHEAIPGLGNALPPALQRADARLLKHHGCNFVRLSHYPQHPAFLDACDEFGLLVYAELASWKRVRRGAWLRAAERQLRALIARDRHHPSVILWGLGNEARSRVPYERLRAVAMELDPTRPTIYAENHLYRARRRRTLGLVDVWGCNYELDELEAGAAAARTGNVVVSELANYPPAVRGDLAEEAAQVALIARDVARVRGKPHVAGFALWCWADYATLRKDRYMRHCGIVDAWRLPKLAAALMEAMFREEPVLHLRGDWGRSGAPTRTIHVFSNCGQVDLRIGTRVIQSLTGGPHWSVAVPYVAESLVGEGARDGRIAFDALAAFGEAHRLELHGDSTAGEPQNSGLVALLVRVLDRDGNRVATWSGWALVRVQGGALLAYTQDEGVPLAGGEGRIFVRLTRPIADVNIEAEASGLAVARWQLPPSA